VIRSKAPNPGERNPQSNPGKEIRNQSQNRNLQPIPGKEIRNQIQEKKSAIKSRKRNPQSNPGKEIRKITSNIPKLLFCFR
jgi:hypothetical protein